MNDKEKMLIIGVIDELLINELDYTEQFTEDERVFIESKYREAFDTTSPREIREGFINLGRKLLSEIKEAENK